MKAIFKVQIILSVILLMVGFYGCQHKGVKPYAIASLNHLKNVVDTIYLFNDGKIAGVDTELIYVPIDPNDLSKTRADTVITSLEDMYKNGFTKTPLGQLYKSIYYKQLKETEAYQKEMNDTMKKELKDIKDKFDKIYKQ